MGGREAFSSGIARDGLSLADTWVRDGVNHENTQKEGQEAENSRCKFLEQDSVWGRRAPRSWYGWSTRREGRARGKEVGKVAGVQGPEGLLKTLVFSLRVVRSELRAEQQWVSSADLGAAGIILSSVNDEARRRQKGKQGNIQGAIAKIRGRRESWSRMPRRAGRHWP